MLQVSGCAEVLHWLSSIHYLWASLLARWPALITAMVNISWAGKQNLQRLTESLVGLPPTYLKPLINYAWIEILLFKLYSDKGSISYLFTRFCELTWNWWQKWKTSRVSLFSSMPVAFLLWFFNHNQAGKPIHQGFPSLNRDVKPGRKTWGVAALVTHIKHWFLWTSCLERSGSWDFVEWRGTLLFKMTEKKRKMESHYRGLPVWVADLRVNLFSCLTSLSPSKTNRAPNSHAG